MDYEGFYGETADNMKGLKDAVGAVTRLQKVIAKNVEEGNLAELKKNIDALEEMSKRISDNAGALKDKVEAFDTKTYFESGDFAEQLIQTCRDSGIDVKGELGVYEMFPYKVRVAGDAEHDGEVYINRKKIPSFRPKFVAAVVKDGRDRLYKAKFNDVTFMSELADAYETTVLKTGARDGSTQSLTKVYKYLVPTARARKDYDNMAFAFDLARLYEKGTEAWVTKEGKRFDFGTSRDGKTGIRVLSSTGAESYISTIKPLNDWREE